MRVTGHPVVAPHANVTKIKKNVKKNTYEIIVTQILARDWTQIYQLIILPLRIAANDRSTKNTSFLLMESIISGPLSLFF